MNAILQTTFSNGFFNENAWISIDISLTSVLRGPINNIPAFVQIMGWRRPGDKPLFEPMMVKSLTHICVTRPRWVHRNSAIRGAIYFIMIHILSQQRVNARATCTPYQIDGILRHFLFLSTLDIEEEDRLFPVYPWSGLRWSARITAGGDQGEIIYQKCILAHHGRCYISFRVVCLYLVPAWHKPM